MWFREFVQHNIWLKLFALLLATLIWFTIRFAIRHEIGLIHSPLSNVITRDFRQMSILALTNPSETRSVKVIPANAAITISGEAGLIGSLSEQDLQVFVDLTDIENDATAIRKVDAFCPPTVSVLRIVPAAVRIEWGTATHTNKSNSSVANE